MRDKFTAVEVLEAVEALYDAIPKSCRFDYTIEMTKISFYLTDAICNERRNIAALDVANEAIRVSQEQKGAA